MLNQLTACPGLSAEGTAGDDPEEKGTSENLNRL